MRRRDRVEIICDILKFCSKEPKLKSHIMGEVHLSFTQLGFYVKRLVKKEYLSVTEDEEHEQYRTSAKGLKAVESWASLIQIREDFEKRE